MPDLEFESSYRQQGLVCIGVDEVGRGCLAGPVVTAAVCLPSFVYEEDEGWWKDLDDSKKVEVEKREKLSALIWEYCKVQVAWCLPPEIDEWNILRASMVAMCRAALPFVGFAQAVLVDGNQNPFHEKFSLGLVDPRLPSAFQKIETIVKGDARSLSIAAASIVAKVYRDKWMTDLCPAFPGYFFSQHKGYSTKLHQDALLKLGPSPIHRATFGRVACALQSEFEW